MGQVGNNILIIMLSLIAGWLAGWLALHNMNFLTLFLFSWQKSLPGSSPPIGPVIEGGALYFLTFKVFVYLVNMTLSINKPNDKVLGAAQFTGLELRKKF